VRPLLGPLGHGPYVDSHPEPEPQYSRWRAGTTTFGPVGRLLITVVVAFFGWLTYASFRAIDGPLVIADVGAYSAAAFFILRHVWKRDRGA